MKSGWLMPCVILSVILTGCAVKTAGTFNPSPLSSTANADMVGEASITTLLGFISFGDCSIDAAMKQGGLVYARNIDYRTTSFLNIFNQHTTVVYGSAVQPLHASRPLAAVENQRQEASAATPVISPAAEPLYYVRADSAIYGPAPLSIVRQWLQQGRIPATSLIRQEASSEWVPVQHDISDTDARARQ